MIAVLFIVNVCLTLATMLGWLVYEGVALATGAPTISEMVWTFVRAKPFMATMLCLVIGGLLGHLFWQENRAAVRAALRHLAKGVPP